MGSQHECWNLADIWPELQQSQGDEGPAGLLSPQKTTRRGQVLGLQLAGRVKTPLCLSSCYRRSGSINLGWILILNLNIKVYLNVDMKVKVNSSVQINIAIYIQTNYIKT